MNFIGHCYSELWTRVQNLRDNWLLTLLKAFGKKRSSCANHSRSTSREHQPAATSSDNHSRSHL